MACYAKFVEKHADNKRMGKASRNKGHSHPPFNGVKFVAYCPICPLEFFQGKQTGAIGVAFGQRFTTCRQGHTFPLRRGS